MGTHTRPRGDCHRRALAQAQEKYNSANRVPVAPFRERYLYLVQRNEMRPSDLCYWMGWTYRIGGDRCEVENRKRGYVKPNIGYARRVLGINSHQQHVSYEMAERLCRALGLDPVEVGI